jgi:hypothetical protein
MGCIALCGGCSKGPRLGSVRGTVTFNDQPLAKGTIVFETAGARPATGRIENGQIADITTFDTGDGVPVGSHKVAIFASADAASAVVDDPGKGGPTPGPNYMSGKSLIPERYNDPEKSGLVAEIKSGDNSVEFKLSSP